MKISKTGTSIDLRAAGIPRGCCGFTLLELIISMTIVSMLVLVLYYAFSVGIRAWEPRDEPGEQSMRLEAAVRLVEEDFRQVVSYSMFWEKGEILLFAGSPNSVFYVTKNGLGATSGAKAGLFFASLWLENCPDSDRECLFLAKQPYPARHFIEEVEIFKERNEFQRKNHVPTALLSQDKILVLEGIEEAAFSFSSRPYIPFGGTQDEMFEKSRLEESWVMQDNWVEKELPRQIKFDFTLEKRQWRLQVPLDVHPAK